MTSLALPHDSKAVSLSVLLQEFLAQAYGPANAGEPPGAARDSLDCGMRIESLRLFQQ